MRRVSIKYILLCECVVLVAVLGFAHYALAADGGGGCTGVVYRDSQGNINGFACVISLPCWGTGQCPTGGFTYGPPLPGGGMGYPQQTWCACQIGSGTPPPPDECHKTIFVDEHGNTTTNVACEQQTCTGADCKTIISPIQDGYQEYCDCQ